MNDTAIRPSVCPSPRRAAALGYRHAGCLHLSHVWTADPSADGRRSAASRTAVDGGHIVSSPPGRQLVFRVILFVCPETDGYSDRISAELVAWNLSWMQSAAAGGGGCGGVGGGDGVWSLCSWSAKVSGVSTSPAGLRTPCYSSTMHAL